MDITTFLAQLWGPVLIAISLGIFVSRTYYIKIYHELEKDAFAVLMFGMIAMTAGIAQILVHNVWGNFPQGLVSFLGWATLVKGALFVVAPGVVDRGGDTWVNMKLVPFTGGAMLLVGVYLSWVGYFM